MNYNQHLRGVCMKKIISVLLILCLIFTVGCGAKTEKRVMTASPSDQDGLREGSTGNAVEEVDAELNEIEELDDSFLETDLEELDSDLDFEI